MRLITVRLEVLIPSLVEQTHKGRKYTAITEFSVYKHICSITVPML